MILYYLKKSRVGGILLVANEDYEKTEGMSNTFWGWGLEDDEFFIKLYSSNVKIGRPVGITTGKNGTFKDIHNKNRARDTFQCFDQKTQPVSRLPNSGVKSTKYNIKRVFENVIDDAKFTILDVELKCDRIITPWCECKPEPNENDL